MLPDWLEQTEYDHLLYLEQEYNTYYHNNRPKPLLSIHDKRRLTKKKTKLDVGNECVDLIKKLLDSFPTRADVQEEMHDMMVKCCNRIMYEDAVERYPLEIQERNNFMDLLQEIIIIAIRRLGKSEAIAQFASAMVIVKKNIETSIFSTGKRASGKTGLSGKIRNYLVNHFNVPESSFIIDNGESIHIKFGENDVRKINAYPASVETYVLQRQP